MFSIYVITGLIVLAVFGTPLAARHAANSWYAIKKKKATSRLTDLKLEKAEEEVEEARLKKEIAQENLSTAQINSQIKLRS